MQFPLSPTANKVKQAYIKLSRDGVCPTMDEVSAEVGFKGKSGRARVHAMVDQLIQRGHAIKLHGKHRGIKIL